MRILFVTGLTDIERSGNQSFRNALDFYHNNGHLVEVFTFMYGEYPNLLNPKEIYSDNVSFHRLPKILSVILKFGKKIKDHIGRKQNNASPNVTDEKSGTYLKEHNSLGRLLYILFQFIIYFPIESIRVLSAIRFRPDVIYGVNSQGAVVASFLGLTLRKPVVLRFHGVSLSEYDLAKGWNRLLLLDELIGLRAPSKLLIITNDGTNGDKIAIKIGVPRRKVKFLKNGIDTHDFDNTKHITHSNDAIKSSLGIKNDKVILMTSRLSPWKRVDRGITLMEHLSKRKAKGIVLCIAGDGPERNHLESMAKSLHIADSIRFLGHVPHDELSRYFHIADIFLSLYDVSNLGNPIFESLFHGVPIVTINDGSTDPILADGINAILIRPDRIESELPDAVQLLLSDKSLHARLSENAKSTFGRKVLTWNQRMRMEFDVVTKNCLL